MKLLKSLFLATIFHYAIYFIQNFYYGYNWNIKGQYVDIFILTSIILAVTTLVVGKIFFEMA